MRSEEELFIAHHRGGYRDPESQAFIESWFSKLMVCRGGEPAGTLTEAPSAPASGAETQIRVLKSYSDRVDALS